MAASFYSMTVVNIYRTKRRYHTLCIDPPWNYTGNKGDKRHPGRAPRSQAEDFYPVMETKDLFRLPVKRLAKKNAHMYLWVTNAFLLEGCLLMKHWGFRQVSMITWVKNKWGTGWHFRGQTEHMLFGVRGSQPIPASNRQSTYFYARALKHSAKPRESYRRIKKVSPAPRIELFARRARKGWDSWGNEAKEIDTALEKDIEAHL